MVRTIERPQVQELVARGARLVEVLSREEFEDRHLRGAESLPLEELTGQRVDGWDRDGTIVVYCNDSA